MQMVSKASNAAGTIGCSGYVKRAREPAVEEAGNNCFKFSCIWHGIVTSWDVAHCRLQLHEQGLSKSPLS